MNVLQAIQTPAYVADIAKIKANLEIMKRLKEQAGCSVLLALKAFSMFSVFDVMRDVLDGTTASGLYEARLGHEHFGKEIHTYSPAYDEQEIREVLKYSSHIYFNSVSQLERFAPLVRAGRPDALIGLRVNPRLSLVKNSALYDPSAPNSRFGVQAEELTGDVLEQVDILHFHNLCENMAEDSVKLIDHVISNFGQYIRQVKHLNLGGGHYITHPDYRLDLLVDAIKRLRAAFDVSVTLEPGGTHVYKAGYLVTTVLDIIGHDGAGGQIAMLDTSASTHMPDVLEVPYRPPLLNSGEAGEKAHTYILGGKTCMSGDVIGTYSFDAPLEIGDRLIFEDMMQYAMVKNTTFNGVPLADIGILNEDGSYTLVRRFGYEDFKGRLS